MLYLASYDIEDNKLRTKVANCFLAYGLERIQLSVFVGSIEDDLWMQLTVEVNTILNNADSSTTRVLLMPLAEAYARKTYWLGDNPPDWPYHCQEVHTLIL